MGQHSHLYGRQWRRRRAEQLRLHPLCCYCAEANRVEAATVADHATPHRGDPVLFRGPLQSLCDSCHSGRKQAFEATGQLRGADANGMPIDPHHAWNLEPSR